MCSVGSVRSRCQSIRWRRSGFLVVHSQPIPGGALRSGTDVKRPHPVCTLKFIISLLEAPSRGHPQVLRLYPQVKRPLAFVPSQSIISLLEAPSGVQPSYVQGAEGAPGDGIPRVWVLVVPISHAEIVERSLACSLGYSAHRPSSAEYWRGTFSGRQIRNNIEAHQTEISRGAVQNENQSLQTTLGVHTSRVFLCRGTSWNSRGRVLQGRQTKTGTNGPATLRQKRRWGTCRRKELSTVNTPWCRIMEEQMCTTRSTSESTFGVARKSNPR
jgi:hypothetical protein